MICETPCDCNEQSSRYGPSPRLLHSGITCGILGMLYQFSFIVCDVVVACDFMVYRFGLVSDIYSDI
jgi:hypothetical protein